MPSHYGQFCPVAKAMELLDERWTLLIIRELMMGSQHFNALRRGVPRMSPALLSKRLQTLVRAGVVERWEDGNRVTYRLTESGKELEPIVVALGQWGIRWISELGDEDLDPHLLLWDIRRGIDTEAVPDGRTVIGFVFPDDAPGLPALVARHHGGGRGCLRLRPRASRARDRRDESAHDDPHLARRPALGHRPALR